MKTKFFILTMVFVCALAVAQTSELERLTDVPALIPENDPPTDGVFPGDLITFDKLVMITAVNASGLETQIHLYINTENGDIATITGKAGNSPDGSFNIEDPKFRMQYFNSHGRVYNFYTRKKNGNIVKYMSSLNTEIYFFSSGMGFQRTTVYRTGDASNPLPQNFDANSYKASGGNAPTLVLCGGKPGTEPNKLLLKRFIGYSGIGYVKTDEGIFMVVKMTSDQGSFTANKWKNQRYEIRVSDFQHVESAMYEDMTTNNEKKTQKLEAKTFEGACASIERQINDMKLEQQRKEKTNIENLTRGSALTDVNTRNAVKGLYGDPVEQMDIADKEIDLKLCRWEQIRVKTDYDIKRKACYIEEKARIQQAKIELTALKEQYSGADDPPLMMTPEYRAILKRMQTKSTNCK